MNPNLNPDIFFDSGIEASYSSSSHDSLVSVEDSSNNLRDDISSNLVSNVSQTSTECNTNSDISFLKNTNCQKSFDDPIIEPEVGMVFQSEEHAFSFYNTYAKRKGFSVRKGHLGRRKDGTIRDRVYLCSYEGIRQKHCSHNTRKPRPVVRTNCMARIEYKVTREHAWIVSKVIYEHNHPFIRQTKAHLLRSHRKITDVKARPVEIQNVSVESISETETAGFMYMNQSNHLHTNRMKELEKGDVQILLDFLKSKQLEDPSFFYAIQLDDKEQVTNIFWADPRSVVDYSYFGDVVQFDTTYRISKNDIPIALFIGINHHKQAVLFAAALLLDETAESFIWLFRTFMVIMSEKHPRTIFTDMCSAISQAVNVTLPGTCHRICLWQLIQNTVKNISHLLGSSYSDFQKEFKNCIYGGNLGEKFPANWVTIMNKYSLSSNSYFGHLYENREKWSLIYSKNIFSAGMTTVQWSDTMKKLFKKHFNRKQPLPKFIEQYYNTLIHFRKKELYEDYRSRQTKPVLLVDMPMLDEAAESYSRLIYQDFEEEFKNQLSCLCEVIGLNGSILTFKVSVANKDSYGIVDFNPTSSTVSCSCQKFESMGILCMHAIKVLNKNNMLDLPAHYILRRWTKYANDGMISYRHQTVAKIFGDDHLLSRFNRVCHKSIIIATKCAFSKDALDIFNQELDKIVNEVDDLSRNGSLENKEVENANDSDRLEDDDEIRKREGRKAKDTVERKRKKKAQLVCESSSMGITNQPSQRQSNDVSGSSHHPDNVMIYNNTIQFPPDHVMPAQEAFTTSQSLFDQAMSSQGVWCAPRVPSSTIHVPIIQGQTGNFLGWTIQPHTIPNIAQSQQHLNQSVQHNDTNQQQTLNPMLNFDINKGG